MRKLLSVVFILVSAWVAFPVHAQEDDRRLHEFYSSLDLEIRVWLQRGLIWTDHYVGIADGNFGGRSIEAVRSFQRSLNQAPSGLMTKEQLRRLSTEAARIENAFGYRLHHDPATGATIGLPGKFVTQVTNLRRGTQFASSNGEVDMVTIRIPLAERSLSDLYRIHTRKAGRSVEYSVFRGDWFVVTGKEDGKHFYVRAHSWGEDIRGFAISYPTSLQQVFGRLTTAMSSDFKPDSSTRSVAESRMDWGSFSARFGGPPAPTQAPAPSIAAAPPVQPQAPSGIGGPSEPPRGNVTTGSGFLVSTSGHFLTNAHVVESCRQVSVGMFGNARLIDRDATNDLALLKVDAAVPAKPLAFSEIGPRLGEEVIALGYPLQTILQNGLNVTKGDVSSLAGMGGDSRFLQFTAAIQPGNSGGPLVSKRGAVLGVVTSKLNAMKIASAVGDVPQSVNFAIQPQLAELYLRRHGITVMRPEPMDKTPEAHEVIAKIRDAVNIVICTQ